MESNGRKIAIGIVGVAIVALVGYAILNQTRDTRGDSRIETLATTTLETTTVLSGVSSSSPSEDITSRVQLALLDIDNLTQGKQRGCDRIIMVPYRIGAHKPSLDIALRSLFSWDEEYVGDWLNFIARANNTLTYQRSTVEGGIAYVYLSGDISGIAGTCDDQRIQAQIEETALQFSEIKDVQIYLNNVATDITKEQ